MSNDTDTLNGYVRTPTPSTPPFLNLASPDLKNFKSFLRSPANKITGSPGSIIYGMNQDDLMVDIGDMDFEKAYDILTRSPVSCPSANTSSSVTQAQNEEQYLQPMHNVNTNKSPKRSFNQPDSPDFNKLFFQGSFSSSRMASPVIDLETLSYFNNASPGSSELLGQPLIGQQNPNELLSINESNALEQFLDSIIDDKAKDEKTLMSELLSGFEGPYNDKMTTSLVTTSPDGLTEPLSVSESDSIPSVDSVGETKQRQRKKRKLLSEEQKKNNHTSSEQRRRGMVKESFDELAKLLPRNQDSTRKNQSKSVILQRAALEIERIERINNELQKLLNEML